MSNEKQLPPCDAEVFEKGESIGLFPGLEKDDVERLCKGLSAVTGWRIDWSYFAGRPHIRALAPAEQYPGLATAWFDPGYQEFITAQGREATLRIGDGDRLARYSVPLFSGAQAGEVVALRSAILRAGEREHELRTTLADLRAQLDGRDVLLREVSISPDWSLSVDLQVRISDTLSASAEPSNDLCAEGAHDFVPFRSDCVKCGEPYSAEPSAPEYPRVQMVRAHKHTCANVQPGATIADVCDCGAVVDGVPVQSAPVERDERAAFEHAFVVQEGVFFSPDRKEYRSMNGRSIEEHDAIDLNLRLSGWNARAALERKSSALVAQLQADLTARDERLDQFEQVMQKVATLRGTLDLHGLREEVEALLWPDLHSRPEERGTPEAEPCSGCGTPGWTGACDKCVPY